MACEQQDLKFRLRRFNPRRIVRGCADVAVIWSDGTEGQLWMTSEDVEENIKTFGPEPGLLAARRAYQAGVEITFEEADRQNAEHV